MFVFISVSWSLSECMLWSYACTHAHTHAHTHTQTHTHTNAHTHLSSTPQEIRPMGVPTKGPVKLKAVSISHWVCVCVLGGG